MIRILVIFGVIMSILFVACNDEGTKSENSTSDTSQSVQSPAPDTSTSVQSSSQADSKRSMDEVMKSMMQNVHSMKMTEDPDHDFAMMMKHHHDAAIEMSNIEISGGKSAELKQLAQKIIDDSKKDNAELETFLSQHQPKSKSDFSKKSMDMMMKSSSETSMQHGNDIDKQFAMMMIKHHQDGIEMSRLFLKSAKEQKTKEVAGNTIKANSEDIKKLKEWQGQNKSGA